MSSVIEVTDLTKAYGEVLAVDHINFCIGQGQTVALLGANGAGKTTTISMLLGLLIPTAGAVRILGHDMAKDRYAVLTRMNFSSPYANLPSNLSVRENLDIYARLYGLKNVHSRIQELAKDLDIEPFLDRAAGRVSAGQKTRVALAKALINEPDVLLLDEPTASLDPDTADWVRQYLKNYQQRKGATILLASHNMQEVERICDFVLMMRAGKLVDEGTPVALISKYGRQNLEEVFLDIARHKESGERKYVA